VGSPSRAAARFPLFAFLGYSSFYRVARPRGLSVPLARLIRHAKAAGSPLRQLQDSRLSKNQIRLSGNVFGNVQSPRAGFLGGYGFRSLIADRDPRFLLSRAKVLASCSNCVSWLRSRLSNSIPPLAARVLRLHPPRVTARECHRITFGSRLGTAGACLCAPSAEVPWACVLFWPLVCSGCGHTDSELRQSSRGPAVIVPHASIVPAYQLADPLARC